MSGEPGTRKVTGRRDRKSVVLDTMLVFTLDFRSAILYTDSAWQTATKKQGVSVREHEHSETRAAFLGQSSPYWYWKSIWLIFAKCKDCQKFLDTFVKKQPARYLP